MQLKCSDRVERGNSRPSHSRFTSDNMQARNEMQSQDIPDELKAF